jgi:hypothetical protein
MTTKQQPKWEIIYKDYGDESGPWVSRLPVPGGWLYWVQGNDGNEHVVFVPEAR